MGGGTFFRQLRSFDVLARFDAGPVAAVWRGDVQLPAALLESDIRDPERFRNLDYRGGPDFREEFFAGELVEVQSVGFSHG